MTAIGPLALIYLFVALLALGLALLGYLSWRASQLHDRALSKRRGQTPDYPGGASPGRTQPTIRRR